MEFVGCGYNFNKVKTKEELIAMLDNYNGILDASIEHYLEELINLDYSIVSDKIVDVDRRALSELEIYKRIAIYNIYNRAYNMFSHIKSPSIIVGNESKLEGLSVYHFINDRTVKLFGFDYGNRIVDKADNNGFTESVGVINLYQTIEDSEMREKELNRVIYKLQCLRYGSRSIDLIGMNRYQKANAIADYEHLFNLLDGKKQISETEKLEVEITKLYHDKVLEDYGLTSDDFEEEYVSDDFHNKSCLQKRLIRKTPSLTIVDNIKYV